jgi:molybdopterin molybdotransferase
MTARLPYRRPTTPARLTEPLRSAPGKAQYARARYEVGYDGPTVTVVGGHGSHLLGDLSAANALIAVAAETTSVEAGTTVPVLVLDRDF